MLLIVTCLTCHLLSPQEMGQPSSPPQGHMARQRDLLRMGRGQPRSHTIAIAIPCQVRCCRVCSQLQAGREGTRPGKVQLSELSVLRKQSRTGDTPMLPICSPVSQLPPPTHTHTEAGGGHHMWVWAGHPHAPTAPHLVPPQEEQDPNFMFFAWRNTRICSLAQKLQN